MRPLELSRHILENSIKINLLGIGWLLVVAYGGLL